MPMSPHMLCRTFFLKRISNLALQCSHQRLTVSLQGFIINLSFTLLGPVPVWTFKGTINNVSMTLA